MPNFFQAPAINTVKPFEPPEFDIIRQLLAQQFIQQTFNPFGVQGASGSGNGMPLPPSWSPYGVGGAQQGTQGAMWSPFTGSYGGQSTAGGGGGWGSTPPPPPSSGSMANSMASAIHHDGYDSITAPPPDSQNTVFGAPTEGQNNPTGGGGWGGTTPTESQNNPTGGSQAGLQSIDPYASSGWMSSHSYNPFGNSSGTYQDAPHTGTQNANWGASPWQGMTRQQFGQSMADNVGGGGISGLQRLLGPNWQQTALNSPQQTLPGFNYTGAQHELGGNDWIGAAGARAGMTPQQMALWTAQGFLGSNGFGPGAGQGVGMGTPAGSGATPWANTLSNQAGSGTGSGPLGTASIIPGSLNQGVNIGYRGFATPTEGQNNPTGGSTPPPPGTTPQVADQNPWSSPGGFPWTQGYQGQFTAPMNPWETNAYGQYSNFINQLMGQGTPAPPGQMNPWQIPSFGAPGANPQQNQQAMNQIEQGARGWQDYENAQALRRIQSSSAAGGGAMSGANLQAQSDYLNNANNLFNQTMGTMQLQNLQNWEGLANSLAQSQIGAGAALGASGQYAGAQEYGAGLGYQENLMGLANQGYNNMFGMGQVAQGTEQNQYNAAYNDWIRQTQNMENMFMYPNQLGLSQLQYGRYPNQQPNAYGSSQASQWYSLLQSLFGGGGSGGNDWLSQLINGYNQGSNPQQPAPSGTQGNGLDGEARYDGGSTPTAPTGANYWLNQLNQAEQNAIKQQNAGQPSSGAQTASGILSLLSLLLGGAGVGQGGGSRPATSGQGNLTGGMAINPQGGGLLGLIGKGIGSLFAPKKKPSAGNNMAPSSAAPSLSGTSALGINNPLSDLGLGQSNTFGDLGGYNSTSTPYDYNQGPSLSLGWGSPDPNTSDMGGYNLGMTPSDLGALAQMFGQDPNAGGGGGDFGGYNPSNFGGGGFDLGGGGGGAGADE
jgi:hypothetical protein